MSKPTVKRAIALVLVVSGMLVVTGPGTQADYGVPTHRHKGPPCSLSGSTTIYQDETVRVYYKYDADYSLNSYACLYQAGKRRLIFQTPEDWADSLDLIQRRGHRIAFWDFGGGKYGNTWSFVCVFDVGPGKLRCSTARDYVKGVGLTPAGSVAWLEAPTELTGGRSYVRKRDARAKHPVLLDSGADIDPDSFAVGGHHIYWTRAGAPQSATMP